MTARVWCRGGPEAGRILGYEYISGDMIAFDVADCALAIYLLTTEIRRTPDCAIPVGEFIGMHEGHRDGPRC